MSERKVRLLVWERDGWACRCCRNRNQLQSHHIKFRSHGGEDTTQNEITLCQRCHDLVHNEKMHIEQIEGRPVDANQPVTFRRLCAN